MHIRNWNDLIISNLVVLAGIVVAAFTDVQTLRVVLGLPVLLFIPGYVLIAAVFPGRDDIPNGERWILSVAFSFVTLALIGLLLNYVWSIRLTATLTSQGIFIVLCSVAAVYRRGRLPHEFRYRSTPFWGGESSRPNRILNSLLAVSIVATIGTLGCISDHGEREEFTYYYVDGTRGADSNPGTAALPWKTITKAAQTLVAGETVYIRGGRYHEKVVIHNSGSAGNWITFQNYPGETPILDGTGINVAFRGLIYIEGKSYIRIQGFHIQNVDTGGAVACGIMAAAKSAICHDIEILDNYITHTDSSGIFVGWWGSYRTYNVKVSGNELHFGRNDVYGGQEVISVVYANNVEVSYNEIYDVVVFGGYYPIGIDFKQACHDCTAHHNIVEGHGVGVYLDARGPTYNMQIYNNILRHNASSIAIGSENNVGYLTGIDIHDNYCDGVSQRGTGIFVPMTPYYCQLTRVKVYHNTIVNHVYGITAEIPISYYTDCEGLTPSEHSDNTFSGNTNDICR